MIIIGFKETAMKKNLGKTDRIIRVLIGAAALAAGIYFKSWFGLLGLIPILSSAAGRCPAYTPFGISTCSRKQ